jgi:uncharacterized membrane protein
MESEKSDAGKWVENAADFVEAYRHLITIKIVEHTSRGASISLMGIIMLMVGVFVLLFTGLGSAWWLGEYFNNMKAGFFIVGGVYIIALTVLLLMRKGLMRGIRNLIIKGIYEQD